MRATTKKNPATTGFAAAVNRRPLRTTRDLAGRTRRWCGSRPQAKISPANLSSVETLRLRPATSPAARENCGTPPAKNLRCGTCLHPSRRGVSKGGTCQRPESAAHAQKQEVRCATLGTTAPVSEYSKGDPRHESRG